MAEPVWRAAPAVLLRTEPMGDLTAIFDRRSMQTHLVAPPMPEILATLQGSPCDAAALAKRLADRFDLSGEGDAVAIVADRLAELAAMGLVERA